MQFDTRPAAYAVIIRDAGILLAYWKQDGREGWTLPGGGLDLAEHPVDGCRREIHEETGYDAEVGAMLGIDVGHWPSEVRLDGGVAGLPVAPAGLRGDDHGRGTASRSERQHHPRGLDSAG